MYTLQALIITLSILLIGILLLYIITQLAEILMKKKIHFHSLFFNFKQKMWMTAGLGALFFSFYILVVLICSCQLDPAKKLALFFDVYHHPTNYIYLGLSIFVTLSILGYIVRLFIIQLFHSKKR